MGARLHPLWRLSAHREIILILFYWLNQLYFIVLLCLGFLGVFMSYFIRFRVLEPLICVLFGLGVLGYKYMLIASKKIGCC
jgi:hypothetical protein